MFINVDGLAEGQVILLCEKKKKTWDNTAMNLLIKHIRILISQQKPMPL